MDTNTAIARAVDHANAVSIDWSERAYSWLRMFVQNFPGSWTTTTFRAYAEENGLLPPPDSRAYGSVIVRAKRAQLIYRVGYTPNPDPRAHHRPTALWRKV